AGLDPWCSCDDRLNLKQSLQSKKGECYFDAVEAAFAKSPALKIDTFDRSRYLRIAAFICSGVSAEIFLSKSASHAIVRFKKRYDASRRGRPWSCERLSCWDWRKPDFAAETSSAVKPPLITRCNSSLKAASSFDAFCGA